MTLGETQELFAELEAKWVTWVLSHYGWKLRHGEGRILALGPDGEGRRARLQPTGLLVKVEDAVHKKGGAHYNGHGADWQLFVNGAHITKSEDPAWVACGEHWESLHPSCAWGGRFQDGNHISIRYGGIA